MIGGEARHRSSKAISKKKKREEKKKLNTGNYNIRQGGGDNRNEKEK